MLTTQRDILMKKYVYLKKAFNPITMSNVKFEKVFAISSMVLFLISIGIHAFAGNPFKVDPRTTTVKWTGEKVSGRHYGKISVQSGQLTWENGIITAGKIVMDMNSITCEDLTDATWNNKLIGHLKSDDFFSVAKNPTSTLVIKKSVKTGDKLMVIGALTIKGITKEIEFMADIFVKGNTLKATAEIVVNRADFNVRYGSQSFFDNLGDKVIYDDFKLEVSLNAAQ
jgi:polyisoprenoid-binding protein YceI